MVLGRAAAGAEQHKESHAMLEGSQQLGEEPTAQDTLVPFSLRSLVSFVTATFCKSR